MNSRLNKYKYPGAKRLMLEAQELKDNTEDYCAQPLDDNLFEWHFTVRGPPDTAFDGGYYHGRLSFPTEYPMKPPSIILFTPNGRFEINKKICLSISGHHPETWQPSWSVRTALLALIAFMPTKAHRAIGSLNSSDSDRRRLAMKSRTWRCDTCGLIKDLLVPPENTREKRVESGNSCEPGTSRVLDNSSEIESDRQSQSSDQSMKDSEIRDSSPDLKEESPRENSSSEDSVDGTERKFGSGSSYKTKCTVEEAKDIPNQAKVCSAIQHRTTESNTMQTIVNRRRAYPPMVLKSIFILITLLILRRVVMVIQI